MREDFQPIPWQTLMTKARKLGGRPRGGHAAPFRDPTPGHDGSQAVATYEFKDPKKAEEFAEGIPHARIATVGKITLVRIPVRDMVTSGFEPRIEAKEMIAAVAGGAPPARLVGLNENPIFAAMLAASTWDSAPKPLRIKALKTGGADDGLDITKFIYLAWKQLPEPVRRLAAIGFSSIGAAVPEARRARTRAD